MGPTGTNSITTAAAAERLELLNCLANAATPQEVAAVIVRLAQAEPSCKTATVLWGLDGTQDPQSEPGSQFDHANLTLARSATAQALPMFSADGHRLAIRLLKTHPAALLLTIDAPADGQRFVDATVTMLQLVGCHLGRVFELADLKNSVKRLERSERLQHALFAISNLAGSDRDMPDVLRGLHAIVGTLMYAENFFIVLHDAQRDSLQFLYYADVEDPAPPGDAWAYLC